MDRILRAYEILRVMNIHDVDILDIKFNHMLDEINIYFWEHQTQICWEVRLEMIGRVIYTTNAFDTVVYTGKPERDVLNKDIANLEELINTDAYKERGNVHISEFDNRLLQIYFNFNALRMTITFKEMSVRQCNPDELDLYMLNRNK